MHFALFLLQNQPSPEQLQRIHEARHMLAVAAPILGLLALAGLTIVIVPFWFICKKAGLSPWLSLLNLMPLGTLILLYVLAFAEWRVVPVPVAPWPPMPPAPPRV